jgi:adenosylhomocysteine nucleosidase
MTRILVVAALPSELPRGLRAAGAGGLLVGARARDLPARLPGDGPVLVTGSCGALTSDHPPGTLVLPDEVAENDELLVPDAALRAALAEAIHAAGLEAAGGRLVQARGFVDAEDERIALARSSGAAFVDLESARIARACAAEGRPWAILRHVTDAPGASLAWLAGMLGAMPEDEPTLGEILRGLARHPATLPKLVALGALVARGRRRVAAVVAALASR